MAKNLMYLYGKNSILERLKSNPKTLRKIFLQENFNSPPITDLIRSKNIPAERVTEKELTRIKRADRLQGIVAQADKFVYADFEDLINQKDRQFSFLFLDGLNDPHNLGSIIRTAACFGGFAVVIPRHSSCEVNETVLHVASGGENYMPISMVTNFSTALIDAKKKGFWIAGAVSEGGQDITDVKFPFPLCLVLGSEGKGIRYGVDKQLELKVTLPMKGAELSFNVAMASSIFCYEIARQKQLMVDSL